MQGIYMYILSQSLSNATFVSLCSRPTLMQLLSTVTFKNPKNTVCSVLIISNHPY
jgi:hypothetical protein